MAERLFKPFILLLSVMAIFAICTSMIIQTMQSSAANVNAGASTVPSVLTIMGDYSYTIISPQAGFAVSTALTSDHMVHPKDAPFIFIDENHTEPSNDKKYVQVIRNNAIYDPSSSNIWAKYKDFISIQRESGSDVFHWHNKWNGAAIPFEQIINNFDRTTNTSVISFDMSYGNDTLFVLLPSNTTAGLWNDNFTIFYGWSLLRAQHVDYWQVIGTILTARIPGIEPRIQFALSFFWIFSYTFIGFNLVTRIKPTGGSG